MDVCFCIHWYSASHFLLQHLKYIRYQILYHFARELIHSPNCSTVLSISFKAINVCLDSARFSGGGRSSSNSYRSLYRGHMWTKPMWAGGYSIQTHSIQISNIFQMSYYPGIHTSLQDNPWKC